MSTSATRCATVSRELAESPAATASVARTWLLVEQPGPWGAKAFSSSHLDPEVGRALERAVSGTGVRVALIRRPGPHPDGHRPDRRRVFAAHTVPGAGWLREAWAEDPAELLGLDFAGLGGGSHGGFGSAYEGEPLAAVCTNGRRDRCCAILGRSLAAELAASGLGQVWEVTHLGGHRFSPTMLVLPYGYSYGRLDVAGAKAVLEATRDGRMAPDPCRGRSAWERPGQAAELAVRRVTGETRAEALRVTGTREDREPADGAAAPGGSEPGGSEPGGSVSGWTVDVRHADGRVWKVGVAASASLPPRPESCGAVPVASVRMEIRSVDPR